MDIVNASDIRAMMSGISNKQYNRIIDTIKAYAKMGKTAYHIYEPFEQGVEELFLKGGFVVYHHPSIDIQTNNLYYTVHW